MEHRPVQTRGLGRIAVDYSGEEERRDRNVPTRQTGMSAPPSDHCYEEPLVALFEPAAQAGQAHGAAPGGELADVVGGVGDEDLGEGVAEGGEDGAEVFFGEDGVQLGVGELFDGAGD